MDEKKDKLDLLLNKYFNSKKEEMLEVDTRVSEPCAMYNAVSGDEELEIEELGKNFEPCPSQDVILSYIEDTMDDDKKSVFEKHVNSCRNCRSLVHYGKKLLRGYAEGKLKSPPEDLSKEITSKLSQMYLNAKSSKKNKD